MLDDDEIDQICDAAVEAGRDDFHFGRTPNPYPVTDDRHDIWAHAYRNAYARANGK